MFLCVSARVWRLNNAIPDHHRMWSAQTLRGRKLEKTHFLTLLNDAMQMLLSGFDISSSNPIHWRSMEFFLWCSKLWKNENSTEKCLSRNNVLVFTVYTELHSTKAIDNIYREISRPLIKRFAHCSNWSGIHTFWTPMRTFVTGQTHCKRADCTCSR